VSVSTPGANLLDGTVREGARGLYRVETDQGILLCDLRGRLRKELLYAISPNFRHKARRSNVKARDPLAAGDRVRVLPIGDGRGVIEAIAARAGGALTREATDGTRLAGQVTSVAGVDQVVAVFAAREPEPHLGLLDRLLVLAEAQALAAVVCLNKVDLGVAPELSERLELYRRLGYPVVLASANDGRGLEELRRHLAGRTSALLGPSGVGKSSLLNALEPGLALRVSAISRTTGKGRHTTSGTLVVPLSGGGRIADTAGIRALAMGGAAAGRLDCCFRELEPHLGRCFHADCGHRHEPDCAVRSAVEAGELDGRRYASYCRLYDEGVGRAGRGWRDLVSSRSLVGEGEFRL
jgi:ribosome biogenesis GTPase